MSDFGMYGYKSSRMQNQYTPKVIHYNSRNVANTNYGKSMKQQQYAFRFYEEFNFTQFAIYLFTSNDKCVFST